MNFWHHPQERHGHEPAHEDLLAWQRGDRIPAGVAAMRASALVRDAMTHGGIVVDSE